MIQEWEKFQARLRNGNISRRNFLAAAAALGISNTLIKQALAATPQRGGHLSVGINASSTSDSLDPASINSDYMNFVVSQFYDTLTVIDEHGNARPSLAESWSAKSDAAEWVFKLRKGVSFHNGKNVTAADVVFSINHHRGKTTKSAARALLSSITDIRATANDEITVVLGSGNADIPYLLSDHHLAIAPEDSSFRDGVGTGAFILESFEPGVRTLVRRNPNDWRSDRGYVDSVENIGINDRAARLSALLSGTVHLVNKVDSSSVTPLEKNPQIQVFNISGSGQVQFVMFCDTPPFDDLDLRLALKYAIDREAILKTVLRGNGKIGNDQPIPYFDPFYAADIPQRPYDPDQAKFHYKKSGHNAPVVLVVSEVPIAGTVDMGQIFQSGAAKAGIPLQLNRVPDDGYNDKHWNKDPFCATYTGGRPTADFMLSYRYESAAPTNDTHWYRPKFDALLVAARGELDKTKRKQMYHDLQFMLHEEGGAIIPVFTNYIDAGLKKVHGFVPTATSQMSGWRAAEKIWIAEN